MKQRAPSPRLYSGVCVAASAFREEVRTARNEPAAARIDVTEHGLRRALIVAAVMAAALMQTLDSTITNVALPTIQGNLGASQDEGSWIVTAYTIAAIVVIPITPWLQNRFGRRNYFVGSIIGFTLASIACGSSGDLVFLIVMRVVQGAFGGGLLATAQAILRDTFPPAQLGASQGIFAIGAIMGPALGPPLGGILVDNASWNYVFYINIIPGLFAGITLALMLKDPGKAQPGPIDFIGLGLLALGLGCGQYVLTEGEQHYWLQDPVLLGATIVALVALTVFVFYELYGTDRPIVDLRVLANRSVGFGCLLAIALGGAIFGSTYTLPQFSQGPLGFTPTLSGELFILRAIPILIATPIIVRLTAKVDPRYLLGLGFTCIALGSYLQAIVTTSEASFWSFGLALIITGLGAGLLFVPLSIAVLGATSPADGPKAGAFVNLSTQLGGSFAVAGLDVLISQRQTFHSAVIGANESMANPAVSQYLNTGGSIGGIVQAVNVQALIYSYADATLAIAFVCVLCIPLAFFMRKPQRSKHIEVAGG